MKNENQELMVLDWIKDNQNEMITLLQDLVRIPSVSGEELAVQKRLYQELESMDLQPGMF